MRIVFISPVFYPQEGGGERYLLRLAKKLSSKYEVNVITSAKVVKGKKQIGRVQVYYCPYKSVFGTELVSLPNMFKLLRKLKPDVIHGSGPSITQDLSYFLSRIFKIPMVMTYHADLNLEKAISRLYLKISTGLVLRNLRKIIVTSRSYYELLKSRGIREDNMAIIPVGVEYEKFGAIRNKELMKEMLHLQWKKTVLFVGQLDKGHLYKRLDILIKSIDLAKEKIGNIHLAIVGGGELVNAYMKLVESLQLQDYVSFHQSVNDEELPNYYSAADLLVLPSPTEKEGFGIVLLEAMAAGVPVITSEKCGGAFAIKESDSGLLYKAGDINGLSQGITRVLTDDAFASKLGENGRIYARNYDWSKVAEKVEKLYQEVLGAHHARHTK